MKILAIRQALEAACRNQCCDVFPFALRIGLPSQPTPLQRAHVLHMGGFEMWSLEFFMHGEENIDRSRVEVE